MSTTVPAICGQMGSTRFYQAVMRADELAATVHAAMDFPEFDSFMENERMQRALNEERVEREIVPYLTKSEDRFFGSMIVLVYKPKVFTFEPLKELGATGLHGLFADLSKSMGALTIDGGMLFALDGQHRLHALRTVVSEERTPRLDLPITGEFRQDVKGDMLSVIFLEFESIEKARRIFNKVNRHAKPTSSSTNILTSEDDGYAIVARCIAGLDDPDKFDSQVLPPIPARYANRNRVLRLEGKKLESRDEFLTTLELVHDSVKVICKATGLPPLDEKTIIVRPDDETLKAAYEKCAIWWSALVSDFKPFAEALRFPWLVADSREHDHQHSVAFRLVGQEALIKGMMEAHVRSKLSVRTLVDRMNRLPLSLSDDVWIGVLLGRGEVKARIITKKVSLASKLVAYMLIGSEQYGARRLLELEQEYRETRSVYGITRDRLPKAVN